jgi:hypothetical protein
LASDTTIIDRPICPRSAHLEQPVQAALWPTPRAAGKALPAGWPEGSGRDRSPAEAVGTSASRWEARGSGLGHRRLAGDSRLSRSPGAGGVVVIGGPRWDRGRSADTVGPFAAEAAPMALSRVSAHESPLSARRDSGRPLAPPPLPRRPGAIGRSLGFRPMDSPLVILLVIAVLVAVGVVGFVATRSKRGEAIEPPARPRPDGRPASPGAAAAATIGDGPPGAETIAAGGEGSAVRRVEAARKRRWSPPSRASAIG